MFFTLPEAIMPDYQLCELTLVFENHTETVFAMLNINEYIENTVFDCWGNKGLKDFKWKIVGDEVRIKDMVHQYKKL